MRDLSEIVGINYTTFSALENESPPQNLMKPYETLCKKYPTLYPRDRAKRKTPVPKVSGVCWSL